MQQGTKNKATINGKKLNGLKKYEGSDTGKRGAAPVKQLNGKKLNGFGNMKEATEERTELPLQLDYAAL